MDVPGAGQTQQQTARGNVSYFLFLSMLFFFLNSSAPDTSGEANLRAALARLTRERDDFKDWLYPGSARNSSLHRAGDGDHSAGSDTSSVLLPSGDGHINNTIPSNDTSTHMPFVLQDLTPPSIIRDKVDYLLEPKTHDPVYYRNVSGFFKGSYVTHPDVNITDSHYNLTNALEKQGRFPWAGQTARKKDGKVVRLNVRETVPHVKGADAEKEMKNADIVIFRGSLELELHDMLKSKEDGGGVEDETRTTELDMEGVHYLNNGSIFIHAAPPWKDLDMRQLPGLLLSNHTRNETARTILTELDARLERIKRNLAIGKYPEGGGNEGDTHMNCTFSVYGQLRPLPPQITRTELAEYESELHNPTGRSVPSIPASQMDALVFSKDCNLLIELDNMEGLELDRFWDHALVYAAILTVITALQAWVLVRQMEYTSTPTAIGKVAHLTISMQVVIDVYFCVTHLTIGIVTNNRASLALLVPAFFGICGGLLFGLRYAAIIRVTNYRPPSTTPAPAPAPVVAPPPPPPAAPSPAPEHQPRRSTEIPNTSTPLLPRPDRGAQAVADFDRVEQAEQRKNFAIFLCVAVTVVLSFAYIGWFPILITLVYSFWLPQIYHNAERGSGRNALLKSYILVTAASRLFMPLYIWAYPDNLLFAESSSWVYALVAYQIVQVIFLFLQDLLGPRFFLPKGFYFPVQDTWDYHPILPPSDIENPASDPDKKEVDCVICFERIEMADQCRTSVDMRTSEKGEPSSSGSVGDVLGAARRGANRMSYMVPPCHHLAHTSCLESWAAIKMECPLCRRPLPPF